MPSLSILLYDPLSLLGGLREPLCKSRRGERRAFCFCLLLPAVLCVSCGGIVSGLSTPDTGAVTITVTPSSATPFTGENVQFSVAVENAPASAVTWQVNQTPGGNSTVGTISKSGYYMAPASVPNPPTVTVTAVLLSDPGKSGSASVTIQNLSSIQAISLSPHLSSVTTSQTLQMNVHIAGVNQANNDVSWSVDGFAGGNAAVGTISAGGLYSPPAAAGTHTVIASLSANPAVVASAQVAVTDFPGTLTWRNDNPRSGINNKELVLSPATVSSSTFGWLFSCAVDGYAYAQPLYVPNLAIPGKGTRNVVFVATEKDLIYAFDADASPCQPVWAKPTSLVPTGEAPVSNADMNITPTVGITGTPVIGGSAAAPYLYVVAATQFYAPGAFNPTYVHRLYAVDLATGEKEILQAGREITSPDNVFDSSVESQGPALLWDNETVYVAFGSNGLPGDYHGWLFAYDAASLQQVGSFDVASPPATQGGIWQGGGGPAADENNGVFVATGHGPFNANLGGPSYSYGDSFLRLGMNGGLSVLDYFTPCDEASDESAGVDVGASAPVLLDLTSAPSPHVLIGGSQNGFLYVVNRDAMGGYVPSPCPAQLPPPVQTVSISTSPPSSAHPIFGAPLFWNNAVYVAPGNGNLMSFSVSAEGLLGSSPASQAQELLSPEGASPVVSSNGTNNAVLWLIDSGGAPSSAAILRAYDPVNLSKELYDSAMAPKGRDTAGLAVKFTVPTVANGKVYVGTQGELDVYGLLP